LNEIEFLLDQIRTTSPSVNSRREESKRRVSLDPLFQFGHNQDTRSDSRKEGQVLKMECFRLENPLEWWEKDDEQLAAE
jgi:hypothetical protein